MPGLKIFPISHVVTIIIIRVFIGLHTMVLDNNLRYQQSSHQHLLLLISLQFYLFPPLMPHEEAFCLTVRYAGKDNTNSMIYNFHCNYIAITCRYI